MKATQATNNEEMFNDCTQKDKQTLNTSPVNTPTVLARFVKIPTAKIPAIGTPKIPVTDKNKFQICEALPINR